MHGKETRCKCLGTSKNPLNGVEIEGDQYHHGPTNHHRLSDDSTWQPWLKPHDIGVHCHSMRSLMSYSKSPFSIIASRREGINLYVTATQWIIEENFVSNMWGTLYRMEERAVKLKSEQRSEQRLLLRSAAAEGGQGPREPVFWPRVRWGRLILWVTEAAWEIRTERARWGQIMNGHHMTTAAPWSLLW